MIDLTCFGDTGCDFVIDLYIKMFICVQGEKSTCLKLLFSECHIIENLSFCGGVGACAVSFFEQRL